MGYNAVADNVGLS